MYAFAPLEAMLYTGACGRVTGAQGVAMVASTPDFSQAGKARDNTLQTPKGRERKAEPCSALGSHF